MYFFSGSSKIFAMTILAGFLAAALWGDDPKIEKGVEAPDFQVQNQKEETVKLSSFRDKKNVLLAFYPMDFTPG